MANAKTTEKPTYPIYSSGGCMINPTSCRSGFKSIPSRGAGTRRSKGLELGNTKSKNLAVTKPSNPSTRATMASGSCFEDALTAYAQPVRSEGHTSELQSLMRISYAAFCLKKKKNKYVSD